MRADVARVLESAIPMLATDRATSMQAVAARAGVSRATVVRLFPTRLHLVRALIEKVIGDCDRALGRVESGDGSSVEKMLSVLAAEYRPFVRLRSLVHLEPDVLGVPESGAWMEAIFIRTVQVVERGQASGLLRNDMPATWLAMTFCGLAETAWQLTLEGHMGARQAPKSVIAGPVERCRRLTTTSPDPGPGEAGGQPRSCLTQAPAEAARDADRGGGRHDEEGWGRGLAATETCIHHYLWRMPACFWVDNRDPSSVAESL